MVEPSTREERMLVEAIQLYRSEMTKTLPQKEKTSFFNYHKLISEVVIENIRCSLGLVHEDPPFLPSLKEALGEAFMDAVDSNWEKCEELCRETLDRVEDRILSGETESRSDNYWSLMKRLHKEYNADIGEFLSSLMQFIRLEYLDDRQDTDLDILIEEIQKQAIKTAAAVERDAAGGGTESDIGGDVTSDAPTSANAAEVSIDHFLPVSDVERYETESLFNNSRAIEEHLEKELKLRMTWGRIIIFWKYWIDCRKETIDILNNILDIFEGEEDVLADETNLVQVFQERLLSQDEFDNFPIQFAHIVNKDFSCYKVLLRKLTEFLDLITSSEYLEAFDVESKDLFFNISTFQNIISVRQSDLSRGFEMSENIIGREQEGLGTTAKLLACTSRPLLHLKDLLRKLSDEDRLDQAGIESVINDLQEEETEVSTMFSESLLSFLEVSCKVNAAAEQLQMDIEVWLPKRTKSITKMKEIIEKLNKTTKDVAITQTVSSSVGIVGGAIAIGGLILAPFTLGATLIPSAIAGGVVSGLGAATAIGAAVAEIVIDKGQMENATTCIEEDKVLFEEVTKRIENLNRNSTMLLRYIPQDELESLVSVMTDPQSIAMLSISSKSQVDPRIAINVARLVSVSGKVVLMPVSRLVIAGTIAASRVAVLALAHSIAAIGVALDIANLVLASVKLGKGAKSENAEKLEEVVKRMEEEKGIIENCLAEMS